MIKSNQVVMFPSTRRSSALDRNASIPTENNINSLIYRLTIPCFVIGGITVSNGKIGAGSFNMYGYMFRLKEDIILPVTTTGNNTDKKYLAFSIIVKNSSIGTIDNLLNHDSADNISFIDTNNNYNNAEFTGVKVVTCSGWNPETFAVNGSVSEGIGATDGCSQYLLPIAEWVSDKWETYVNRGDGYGNQANLVKFKANEIRVQRGNIPSPPNNLPRNQAATQNLETYLFHNIVIDGGEV